MRSIFLRLIIFMVLVLFSSCNEKVKIEGELLRFNSGELSSYTIEYSIYDSNGEVLTSEILKTKKNGYFTVKSNPEFIGKNIRFDLVDTNPNYSIEGRNNTLLKKDIFYNIYISPLLKFNFINLNNENWILAFDSNINLNHFDKMELKTTSSDSKSRYTYIINKEYFQNKVIDISSIIEDMINDDCLGSYSVMVTACKNINGEEVAISSSYFQEEYRLDFP